jgi:hypothetical protein
MNAIFASAKLGKPFKISYYPFSTGTYWPFAIESLLNESEILNTNVHTGKLKDGSDFQVGKTINEHPLIVKKISYEKFLSLLRKCKLESRLQFLRRELAVMATPKRIVKISNYYKTISGGFAALNETLVNTQMNQRFIQAHKKSPFTKEKNLESLIVIHYRLGDKRTVGKVPSDFNSDRIVHPESYKRILDKANHLNSKNIYVVSDEPKLAQRLLAEVRINAKTKDSNGDIWEDLYFMSQADIFIGSNSQVSQLANICVENNGGESYLFNLSRDLSYKAFKNTTYLESKFLEMTHKIYSKNYSLEEPSHSAYFQSKNQ